MSKYKPNNSFRAYLTSKAVVAIGYYDKVKQINLNSLMATWIDTREDGNSFSDKYPYAADHIQVEIVDYDDPRNEQGGILYQVADNFRNCQHLKIWVQGELIDNDEIHEMIGAMSRQRILTET
jgi:hypothetical protein